MSVGLDSPVAGISLRKRYGSAFRSRLTPLLYALSSIATAAAQLVSGLVILHWISPADLGLWKIVQVAQVYAFILLAGINNGLGRELPFFLGKGDLAFADQLAGTALSCVTVANGLVLVCGLGAAILFADRGSHLVWAILAITCVIALAFYRQIFTVAFRSKDSFAKLTVIQFMEAGLSMATVPLVYFFHYNGMLARVVVVAGIVGWMTYVYRPMRVRIRMNWPALKLLFKTGLPIFGLDYAKNSAATVDRMVLMGLGGVNSVGIYQLAGTAQQTLGVLASSLASYLYPRMSFSYGQNGDARALWHSGLKFVLITVALTAVAGGCAWLLLPYFVPVFAAKYLGGLSAARIVLLAGVFEGAAIIVNALLSMKAWRLFVLHQTICATSFALAPILGVLFISRSLEGVAWGAVIGSLCRSLSALGLTYYGTHRPVQVS